MEVTKRRLLGLVSQSVSQPACLSVSLSVSVCVVDSMMCLCIKSFNHHDDVLVDTDSSRCCMHAFTTHCISSTFHIFIPHFLSILIIHSPHNPYNPSSLNCQLSTVNCQLSAPTERRSSQVKSSQVKSSRVKSRQVKARQRLHRHIHMSTPAEPAAVSIWDADASGVDTWIRSISALIPKGE
jgi:hypothetical protein